MHLLCCLEPDAVWLYVTQFDGFRQILKSEGFAGLYRGATAAIPRVAVRPFPILSSHCRCRLTWIANSLLSACCLRM